MSEELNPLALEALNDLPDSERMKADLVNDLILEAYANQLMDGKQSVDLLCPSQPGIGLMEPVHDTRHGAYGHFIFLPEAAPDKYYFYNLFMTRGRTGFTGFIDDTTLRVLAVSVPQAAHILKRVELEFNWRTNSGHATDLTEFHERNTSRIINWMNSRGRTL